MTMNVSFRQPLFKCLVAMCGLVPVLLPIGGGHAMADISPRESFRVIQRQVESIEPKLVKSTVVIKLWDGSGSGVIISPDGYVLTAAHVIEGRQGRRVTAVLSDGRSMPASVVAYDRASDMGIIKITDAANLPTSPIGDSSTLRNGEWVLATGHPLGQHEGRPPVLRIGRVLQMSRRSRNNGRTVQTDAPIISGDSGGPLFDLTGRVVGINSMITAGDRRMASIHVPINLAKAAISKALRGEIPDTWDGPPSPFASDMREGEAALFAGNHSAAAKLAREAAEIDPNSAAARILLAHANAHSGQPLLAISAISQAIDRGFNDTDLLRKDPDFAPLGNQPAMIKMLERLDAFDGIPGQLKSDVSQVAAGAPANLSRGVVRIQTATGTVAFGTVMSPDGDILTKASELPDGPLTCVTEDAQIIPLMRRGVDSGWDVALLKANASGLRVLPLADAPVVGEWTFSPDNAGTLAAVGIVGVSDMPVHGKGIVSKPTSKAYMGVRMDSVSIADLRSAGISRGVRVEVQRALPAERAGMETGDIIFEVEGQPVGDPDALMDAMVKKQPGESVTLRLVRGTERMRLSVTLIERPASAGTRMGLPEYLSGEISHMQGPFSRVIQHDSVLKPSAMGGPLVDTDGRCVGINIARADRTSTYAISARDVTDIYNRLKAGR